MGGAVALVVTGFAAAPSFAGPKDPGIIGGTTQSVDPTRYDYVAPEAEGPVPMSASGVGVVSPFSYSWNGFTIAVPAGYLFHSITGSGLTITKESVTYSPAPSAVGAIWGMNVCNARFDFQNRSGSTIYSTSTGSVLSGCHTSGITRVKTGTVTVRTGVQCARLYVNGTYRGEQCHSVFP
jgi:hypothetical protein